MFYKDQILVTKDGEKVKFIEYHPDYKKQSVAVVNFLNEEKNKRLGDYYFWSYVLKPAYKAKLRKKCLKLDKKLG